MKFKVGDHIVRMRFTDKAIAVHGGIRRVSIIRELEDNRAMVNSDDRWFNIIGYRLATPVEIARWRCRHEL